MNKKTKNTLTLIAQVSVFSFIIYIWFFKTPKNYNCEIYCSYFQEEYNGRVDKKYRKRTRNVPILFVNKKEVAVIEWLYSAAEAGDSILKKQNDNYYIVFKEKSIDSINVRDAYLSDSINRKACSCHYSNIN